MQHQESRRNFLWNSVGAGLNSLHSPLFLFAVTRFLDLRAAGYFSLAYATGLMLSNIGLFGVRSYQITDISGEHSDEVYLKARLISTGWMMLATLAFALGRIADPTICWLLLFQGLWRVPESMADVMHGTFQMKGRLDLAGKSLFLRGVLCSVTFLMAIMTTGNLLLASGLLATSSIAVFTFYDVRHYRQLCPESRFGFSREAVNLLWTSMPLFLISILYAYLLNASRFAIELFGTVEAQAAFSVAVLPSSLLWALYLLLLTPKLPRLAGLYFANDRRAFLAITLRLVGGAAALCGVLFVFLYVVGDRLLASVFHVDPPTIRDSLLLACVAGGALCVATVFSNLLVLLREMRLLLLVYGAVAVATAILSGILIAFGGDTGAAVAYLLTMVVLCVALAVGFMYADAKRPRDRCAISSNFRG